MGVGLVLAVLIVAAIAVIWWISTMNSIRVMGLKVQEGLSGIDVALTKRYDVLTKMLDVVKSYQQYERETLIQLVQMRSGMTMKERNEVSGRMDELASQIRVIAEHYPELRSSANFVELQRTIADVEEHLQAARRLYNANVTAYNAKIIMFPNSIVAGSIGAAAKELFVADEGKRQDVRMTF